MSTPTKERAFPAINCPNGHTNCLVKRPGARCFNPANIDVPECSMTHATVAPEGVICRALKDAPVECNVCGAVVLATRDVEAHELYHCEMCSRADQEQGKTDGA